SDLLFRKNLRKLFDIHLYFKLFVSFSLSSFPLSWLTWLSILYRLSWLAFTLPSSPLRFSTKFKTRNINRWHRNSELTISLRNDLFTLRNVTAKVLTNPALYYSSKPCMISFNWMIQKSLLIL